MSTTQTGTFSEVQEVLQLLKEHNLDLAGLKEKLETPDLSVMNVQLFLNQCTKDQLARLFYTSGLVKLAEIAEQAHVNQQQPQQQAAQQREPATV